VNLTRTLELTLQWLNDLDRTIGPDALLDALPNDYGGRAELRCWLDLLARLPAPAVELPSSPGPWTLDRGQIRNRAGEVLASVPYTLGDATDQANGLLMAAAPELAERVAVLAELLFRAAQELPEGDQALDYKLAAIEARGLLSDLVEVARWRP
jgi:hypothetical protein